MRHGRICLRYFSGLGKESPIVLGECQYEKKNLQDYYCDHHFLDRIDPSLQLIILHERIHGRSIGILGDLIVWPGWFGHSRGCCGK